MEENSWLGGTAFTLVFFEVTWFAFKLSPSHEYLAELIELFKGWGSHGRKGRSRSTCKWGGSYSCASWRAASGFPSSCLQSSLSRFLMKPGQWNAEDEVHEWRHPSPLLRWLLRAGRLFPESAESCCLYTLPSAWPGHATLCSVSMKLPADLPLRDRHGQWSQCHWDSSCLDLFFFFFSPWFACSSLIAVTFFSGNSGCGLFSCL